MWFGCISVSVNYVFEITFGTNTDFGDEKVSSHHLTFCLKDSSYLRVYYIKDGVIAERLDATYSNGAVTFITDHLSMYSIGYEVSTDDDDDGGFPVWAIVLIVVAVIAVSEHTCSFRRRYSDPMDPIPIHRDKLFPFHSFSIEVILL